MTPTPAPKGGGAKVRASKPHGEVPKNRSGAPCGRCSKMKGGRRCPNHGGKSTGPKTVEGKKVVRVNSVTHGLRSDPFVFLDNMPPEQRAAFEGLVKALAEKEGVGENPLDLIVVRDIVLADLIAQRGVQYILKEWKERHGDEGQPIGLAQADALSHWGGYARLKATLRAALRQGTGARGDPGKQTLEASELQRKSDAFVRALEDMGVDLEEAERRASLTTSPPATAETQDREVS